jgi:hypothetical protein
VAMPSAPAPLLVPLSEPPVVGVGERRSTSYYQPSDAGLGCKRAPASAASCSSFAQTLAAVGLNTHERGSGQQGSIHQEQCVLVAHLFRGFLAHILCSNLRISLAT